MIKKTCGFHLIELLITLAILAILVSVSLPLYTRYLAHEKRLEAASQLTKLGIALEEYHLEKGTYAGATLEALHVKEFMNNTYQLAMTNLTDDNYVLLAKPINQQATRDIACGTLLLDAQGKKLNTGSENADRCW